MANTRIKQGAIVTPLDVTFFQRKPRRHGNYSIELVFEEVRHSLREHIRAKVAVASFESNGIFRRLFLIIEAIFRQGEVNHVTGDINFVGICLRKSRTVQTIHDCAHLERTKGLHHALLKLVWVSLPVRRCACVTVVSESTRRELLRYLPSCDPEKIVVIPVAISPTFRRREKTFNQECPRILQVGSAPNKNISRLAQALRGISCHLQVIGRLGPDDQRQLDLCNISYASEWNLSPADMVNQYVEADIVVLASTYEGFGMPILEAQATGRPVITSELLSMPEVAGGAAHLVNPFDVESIRGGLLRVIQDTPYRNGLVKRGYENVIRYDPKAIAMQYLNLYKNIATGVNES